jgi:hypothetical protein
MILKIFLQKKIAKKLAFFTQNKAKLCKFLIITLDFKKNANFFAENWEKSPKIGIITSTAGHPAMSFSDEETHSSFFSQFPLNFTWLFSSVGARSANPHGLVNCIITYQLLILRYWMRNFFIKFNQALPILGTHDYVRVVKGHFTSSNIFFYKLQ